MNTITNHKLDCLVEFFNSLKFEKYYYHRYPGNNGDDLIDLGAQIFFKENHINIVNNIEESDCIILCGGAGITKEWCVGIEFLTFANTKFPNLPIIVLPTSLGEEDLDLVCKLKTRSAPFFIWARENYTYIILQKYKQKNFHIGLDHDMAILAKGAKELADESPSINRYILLVERFDAENNSMEAAQQKKNFQLRNSKLANFFKQLVPLEIKRLIKRNIKNPNWSKRDFVKHSLAEIYKDYPEAKNLKIVYCDISLQEYASFKKFIELTKNASYISTMRLHVGILGYLINKPTYLRYGENIPHKIKGVYEYSLRHSPLMKILKY